MVTGRFFEGMAKSFAMKLFSLQILLLTQKDSSSPITVLKCKTAYAILYHQIAILLKQSSLQCPFDAAIIIKPAKNTMITSKRAQDKPEKNSGITNRLIYFFIFLLLVSVAGFYKTYLVKFPDFNGFTWAHHFHGLIMVIWILLLIAQPVFIRTKKLEWHRIVGKASYFIFPLLLLSFFLVTRAAYLRNIKTTGETEALATMGFSGIPDMFYISILYGLGIYYKKKTTYHLRFFACIGLMILGPGLGRFLIATCGLPFAVVGVMGGVITLFTLGWLISDILKKRSAFPMAVFLGIIVIRIVVESNNHSAWWQGFAKGIATHLF